LSLQLVRVRTFHDALVAFGVPFVVPDHEDDGKPASYQEVSHEFNAGARIGRALDAAAGVSHGGYRGQGRVGNLMDGNSLMLSQVIASNYAWVVDGEELGIRVARWVVGKAQGDTRLGLRAVGLENRPTIAAHLDIGRRRESLFGRYR